MQSFFWVIVASPWMSVDHQNWEFGFICLFRYQFITTTDINFCINGIKFLSLVVCTYLPSFQNLWEKYANYFIHFVTQSFTNSNYRQKFPQLEQKNIQFWFKNRRAKCKRMNNCIWKEEFLNKRRKEKKKIISSQLSFLIII